MTAVTDDMLAKAGLTREEYILLGECEPTMDGLGTPLPWHDPDHESTSHALRRRRLIEIGVEWTAVSYGDTLSLKRGRMHYARRTAEGQRVLQGLAQKPHLALMEELMK